MPPAWLYQPARLPACPCLDAPKPRLTWPACAADLSVLQAASDRKKEGSSALDEFCRDLTAEAAQQRTDPVRSADPLPRAARAPGCALVAAGFAEARIR